MEGTSDIQDEAKTFYSSALEEHQTVIIIFAMIICVLGVISVPAWLRRSVASLTARVA